MLEMYTKNEVSYMDAMRFLSLRELRTETGKVKEILSKDNKIVLTSNGKPVAFMIATDEASFEETLDDIRRVRGMSALRSLQRQAKENGLSDMTLDEINAEIDAARREQKERIAKSGVNQ